MVSFSTISKSEVEFFLNEGYLIIPRIIQENIADKLYDEVMNIMEIIGYENSKLRQTTQYLANGYLDKLINSFELKNLASQLLEGSGSVYMPFTAVKSANGGSRFHFHQDNQYTQFDKPGLNFWFALTHMDINNGCLQIIPQSHKNGTFESELSGDGDNHKKIKWEPENFLPIQMKKGDCVVFSRLTIHGSGPNLSNKPRVAYAVQFHRDDVKAKWDNNNWVLLKNNPRWNVKPVEKITPPENVSLEGH